jgi:hypothetical protein
LTAHRVWIDFEQDPFGIGRTNHWKIELLARDRMEPGATLEPISGPTIGEPHQADFSSIIARQGVTNFERFVWENSSNEFISSK